MTKRTFTKTLLASAITFATTTAIAAPYEIIDLGKIEGGTLSFAYGLNNSGEVVGYGDGPLGVDSDGNSFFDFANHGIQFTPSGAIDLGELEGGLASFAFEINDNGLIVGQSDELRTETDENGNDFDVRETFAVVFDSGTLTKIPGLDDLKNTRVFSVNNNGVVSGTGQYDVDPDDDSAAVERGFVVNAIDGTGFGLLPSLTADSADRVSNALSINDSGQVVGWSQLDLDSGGFVTRAILTTIDDPAELIELPNIDTPYMIARDINNNGVIVGLAQAANNTINTVSYIYNPDSDSEPTLIPYFSDRFDSSVANAINDNNQVVGQALVSVPTTGINTGYIYEDGELKDLNALIPCNSGWRIDNATNINNMGEIVGYGVRTEVVDGENVVEVRAFKMVPSGGSVEVCESPDNGGGDDDNSSSGGVMSIFGLIALTLIYWRRKFVK